MVVAVALFKFRSHVVSLLASATCECNEENMSRFTLDSFAAARHFSNPPSSPRKALHSRLLATLDQEMEKIGLGKTTDATGSSDKYSNTMKVALSTGRDGGMRTQQKGGSHVSQMSIPHFFSRPPNVVPTAAPVPKKATSISAEMNTQISKKYAALKGEETLDEPSAELPLYTYRNASPPPIKYYIRDEGEANKFASRLQGPLGFDLEWRVIFRPRMIECKTAVLQLADERAILICQLSAMKRIPQVVKNILERPDIVKMGVNILNDGRKLQRDFGVASAGLLEMSHLARLADPARVTNKRMISLQRIVEMYTGCTLSKGSVRTSNWEAILNEEQLEYAANDAHAALKVYTKLMTMAKVAGLNLKAVTTAGGSPMSITYVSESSETVGPGFTPKSRSHPPKPMSEEKPPMIYNARLKVHPTIPSETVHITSMEQLQSSKTTNPKPVGGQLLRAYRLWHEERLLLADICSALRSPKNPLAKGTVITYIVQALKTDTSLPFSRERLKALVQLEVASSNRHGWWIASLEKTDRGLQ